MSEVELIGAQDTRVLYLITKMTEPVIEGHSPLILPTHAAGNVSQQPPAGNDSQQLS